MKYRFPLLILLFLVTFSVLPAVTHAGLLSRAPNNLGLIGYLPMNEGAGTQAGDFSGNGNNGTITGATWTNGRYSKALSFNGASDYLNSGNASSFSIPPGGSVTMCAWIYSNTGATGVYQGIIAKRISGAPYAYGINFITNDLQVYTSGSSGIQGFSYNVPALQWVHICGVISSSPTALYINGALYGTLGSGGGVTQTADNVTIGASYSSGEFFNGKIDDVRIYNRELSATEVATLYQSGFAMAGANSADLTKGTTLENGLVGLWTMDGTDTLWGSNTMTDRSTSGNTGTMTNMSTTTSPAFGKLAQALSFDGVNDYIGLVSDPIDVNTMTICAWIYPTSIPANAMIVSNARFNFGITSSQNRLLLDSNSTGGGNVLSSINSISVTNVWYHVCAIRNSGTNGPGSIYINGTLDSSGNTDTPVTGFGLAIGNDQSNDYPFPGKLDDMRIYNRVLSVNEIKQLYRLGQATASASQNKTGGSLDSGIVGLWSFDGVDMNWGTNKALDKSGNSNDGNLTNMSTSTSPAIGKIGQALKFDGVDDYINIPSNAAFDTANGTWSFWAYIRELPAGNGDVMIGRHDASSSFNGLGIGVAPTLAAFVNNGSGSVCFAGSPVLSTGQWYHIVFAFSQANGAVSRLYLNGAEVANCTNSASWTFNSQAVRLADSLDPFWEIFDGKIDDVRIYNRMLSADEVKNLYNAGR